MIDAVFFAFGIQFDGVINGNDRIFFPVKGQHRATELLYKIQRLRCIERQMTKFFQTRLPGSQPEIIDDRFGLWNQRGHNQG